MSNRMDLFSRLRQAKRPLWKIGLLSFLSVLIDGCNSDCVGGESFGFELRLIDASSQRPIANGVIATATEGTRVDTLQLFPGVEPPFFFGVTREGVFQLRVEADGFETFVRDNMPVRRSGECLSLKGNRLTIPLVRRQ